MNRLVSALALIVLSLTLPSCSGSKVSGEQVIPSIAGSWEFLATSSTNGTETGIEVALNEGQTLVGEVEEPNGSVSASSSQIAFVTINPTSGIVISFGGSCPATQSPSNSLSGNITALGGPFNFSYIENGNVFNVTATLSGDGQSILNGSYASTDCSDVGSISGNVVPKLSGIYTGRMTLPGPSVDTATATVNESSGTLAANFALTGADNTSLTMSGPVTGNAFLIQGTFQGQVVTYYGYYEATKSSLYLVNASDLSQPGDTLTLQVTQARPPL